MLNHDCLREVFSKLQPNELASVGVIRNFSTKAAAESVFLQKNRGAASSLTVANCEENKNICKAFGGMIEDIK